MKKKALLASAPWRGDDEDSEKFEDAKLKVTKNPGSTPVMHVPRKKSVNSMADDEDSTVEIDPELRYSFQRNLQFLQRVFSIDTLVKPLPPAIGYNVARNLSFFTRIFTQFFDPEGIADAQKSLGLGQEERRNPKPRMCTSCLKLEEAIFPPDFLRPLLGNSFITTF